MSGHLNFRSAGLVAWLALCAVACTELTPPASPTPPPTSPPPPPAAPAPVNYTAIGASDAVGVGASIVCIPLLPCPDGTGYVPTIARDLGRTGVQVTLFNLGVPGAVLGPGVQALGAQFGRSVPANFVQHELPLVPSGTTLVTIFAGGNDTNVVATAADRGAGGADLQGFIDAQIRSFGNEYQALVRGVRERAPSAKIVIANLPNLALVPYSAGYTTAQKQILQRISVGFSTQAINPFAAQGIQVVDLLCDARSYVAANYSGDGFHPSDAGYRYIAGEYERGISGTLPAPPASCAAMTMAAR